MMPSIFTNFKIVIVKTIDRERSNDNLFSYQIIISFISLLPQESPIPEDRGRYFIFSYYLATEMITIFEPPVRNSGFFGGKYLGKTKIAKPGSCVDNPTFYGPGDFYIGALIEGESVNNSAFSNSFKVLSHLLRFIFANS